MGAENTNRVDRQFFSNIANISEAPARRTQGVALAIHEIRHAAIRSNFQNKLAAAAMRTAGN